MTRQNARHARRRPFPWGAAVVGLLAGAFIGAFLASAFWNLWP